MTGRPPSSVVAVVDDDSSILQSIQYLLESADYSVVAFNSAFGLLNSGCLSRVDCLISDIDMPGMDGLALLREVRMARPRLPTVLITGYPERLRSLPARAECDVRVFTKPFQGHDLLEAVEVALQGTR